MNAGVFYKRIGPDIETSLRPLWFRADCADQRAFRQGMPGGIGNDGRIEIEINGRIVLDHTAKWDIGKGADVKLNEAM